MSAPDFIPGLSLAERFYREAVRPILDQSFPGLPHAAGLLGEGSEVLGFDTPVSADHHWGPRALLFLDEEDHAKQANAIRDTLRRRLPRTFLGWSTNFSDPDLADHGVQRLETISSGEVNHRVDVLTLRRFIQDYLGIDVQAPLTARAWLTLPSQKLRTMTEGAVFHDAVGLEELRTRFTWYPHDVWLYALAAGWARIAQEEHLMGRAGQVGDEIGSALIAARLVRDLMRLCFLMERQYAPYPKWFGTAFGRLQAGPSMKALLWRALRAEHWGERDQALAEAYGAVARMHNDLGLTDPLPADVRPFHGRPFSVIFGDRFADALRARIVDPEVRAIRWVIGTVDQWSDSTDLLEATALRPQLEALHQPERPG
jgi:hypothetical protein